MNPLIIRHYQPTDETAVRRICFATAFYGTSMQPHFDDLDLVTEALLGYHLRYERDSIWVAEINNEVAGYLAGCEDPRRFERSYTRRILPRLIWKLIAHGHVFRPRVWRLLADGARNARTWQRIQRGVVARYPAHLHVNLDEECRGAGVGSALLDQFMRRLQQQQIAGVHISSQTEGGKKFFARAGFQLIEKYQAPSFFGQPPREVWIMGRVLPTTAPAGRVPIRGICGNATLRA